MPKFSIPSAILSQIFV